MTVKLSLVERKALQDAIGAERAKAVEPALVQYLTDYAAHHGEMSLVEFREHAAPLIKALTAAATSLDKAPGDLRANFYWPRRLLDALWEAIMDLESVTFHAPKHREKDSRRMLVLTRWTRCLTTAGISVSEVEEGPFALALRVAVRAMDRLVGKTYRGRRPTHSTMQPTIRAVKRALRQHADHAARWKTRP